MLLWQILLPMWQMLLPLLIDVYLADVIAKVLADVIAKPFMADVIAMCG